MKMKTIVIVPNEGNTDGFYIDGVDGIITIPDIPKRLFASTINRDFRPFLARSGEMPDAYEGALMINHHFYKIAPLCQFDLKLDGEPFDLNVTGDEGADHPINTLEYPQELAGLVFEQTYALHRALNPKF